MSESFYNFIIENENSDVNNLRLKMSGKATELAEFPVDFALIQIEARKKTRKKLSGFIQNHKFLFPSVIAAEQSTNESIARYHASLVASGASLLDLTAGLGIDDLSFAENGVTVTACEIDELKCDVLEHNAELLGLSNRIKVINADSIAYLHNCREHFDVIYADPARRSDAGSRVHALADCKPDISASMDMIMSKTSRLLVKTSPLLDLSHTVASLSYPTDIRVLCYRGECKEILLDLANNRKGLSIEDVKNNCRIIVVDLDRSSEISRFTIMTSDLGKVALPSPFKTYPNEYKYLYEPNAGIMKTGAWKAITEAFPNLTKADANTHLFLSDYLYRDFPGRILEISAAVDKKHLKKMKSVQINVVTRNHPLSAPQICSRFSLISGGEEFLYAFRYRGVATMLKASPLKSPFQE